MVCRALVAINEPDEQRRVADASMQLCEQLQIFRNKTQFENQIRGGYPVMASSGVSTSSAPAAASRS